MGNSLGTKVAPIATTLKDTTVQAAAQAAAGTANIMNTAFQQAMAQVPLRNQAINGGGCDCDDVTGGGSRGYFGGDEDADAAKELREYADSVSARAKEDVIRRLARALSDAGIAVDPEGDLNDIVNTLVAKIPNPANGKTFANDAASQEKVCQVIANVLNQQFTPGAVKATDKLIDTSLGPVSVCRAVGEWAHSFSVGVNTEFLGVHASVRNALRSILALDEVISVTIKNLTRAIDENPDPEFQRKVQTTLELVSRAQAERTRQEELLKNILNISLPPSAEMLKIALRSTDGGLATVIKAIGLKPGTSAFGDALASSISGLGTAAAAAENVHAALKKIGISVQDYLNSTSYKQFSALLDDKVDDKLNSRDSSVDIAKFLKAASELRATFSRRAEIGKLVQKVGGDEDETKSTVVKRVEKAKTEKLLLVRDFTARMSRHYDEILTSVKALGPELGRKIPLTRRTDDLRDALVRLRDMRESRIELALAGYYTDAAARERKERFLSSLRFVSSVCADLMGLEQFREASSFLSALKEAIDRLAKTIDTFSDVFARKFGGTETKVGGADDDELLPEVTRSALGLNQVVNEFTYFYYVAKVRTNLDRSAVELEQFGDKYVESLGDAVAARLITLRRQRKQYEDYLSDAGRVAVGHPFPPGAGPDTEANLVATRKMIAQEYDTKEKFYKALQAMDLYMKEFTVGIAKDPDAARDIKAMLDDTQVIARWFTEETGEHLWKAFECMGGSNFNEDAAGGGRHAGVPGAVGAAPAGVAKTAAGFTTAGSKARADQTNDHYYQKLVRAMEGVPNAAGVWGPAAALPRGFGIPQCGIPAGVVPDNAPDGVTFGRDFAAQAKKHISSALDSFQALKNLVNAFSRIGDQFGGRELSSQVFMSPSQIYKVLMDYMKHSALSINRGVDPVAGAAVAVPVAIDATLPTFIAGTPASQNVAAAVGPFEVYFGSVQNALKGNYQVEDRYFALILKAMAAKILTVLGVYDMFDRRTPLLDLNPTRFIVGGADDTPPEIIPDAAELYFRLPRLVEFYRGFLRWDGEGDPLKIAMLPELEGIFSGLIRTIFQRMASPEDGDYSDSELRSVIREINQIYAHYAEKGKDKIAQNAASGLIMEINRRYGLIKADDMKKYWGLVSQARSGAWASDSGTNYAILPGEEDADIESSVRAPSDRYVYPGAVGAPGALGEVPADRIRLDDDINNQGSRRMLLRNFRANLEKEFALIDRKEFGAVSYGQLVRQAEVDIRRAGDKDKAFMIASKLIQSTSSIGMEADKAFMFHETVVVGLNALGALHQFVDNYEKAIAVLNPKTLEGIITDNCLKSVLRSVIAGAPNAVNVDSIPDFAAVAQRFPAAVDAGTRDRVLAGADADYNRYVYQSDREYALNRRGDIGQDAMSSNIYTAMMNEVVACGAIARALGGFGAGGPAGGRNLQQLSEVVDSPIPPKMPSELTDVEVAGLRPRQQDLVRITRFGARYITDYRRMMVDLIESIFALGGSGLVDVHIQQGSPAPFQISFSKLQSLAESILGDVKTYLDIFRGFIPRDVIARFEDRSVPGSLFWLEENFVDLRFRTHGNLSDKKKSFDGLVRQTNAAFNALTRNIGGGASRAVTRAVLTAAGAGAANFGRGDARQQVYVAMAAADAEPGTPKNYETFGTAISALVWYDATAPGSGFAQFRDGVRSQAPGPSFGGEVPFAAGADPAERCGSIGSLIATGPRAGAGAPAYPQVGGGAARRIQLWADDGMLEPVRSMFTTFNQLLARYLTTFVDTGTNKVYSNLVSTFANGVASRSVSAPNVYAHPDLARNNEDFGRRGDPQRNVVVLESLAYILQRLMKDSSPTTQVPTYLVSTLTDIPLYQKEKYRAALPGFVRLFETLAQKGEFIKQIIQKTQIRCDRPGLTGAGAGGDVGVLQGVNNPNAYIVSVRDNIGAVLNAAAVGQVLNAAELQARYGKDITKSLYVLDAGLSSDEMKVRAAEVIDAVAACALSLSSAASDVLKELSDQPMYLQTQEASIESYKLRYGKLPLMPLSHLFYFVNNFTQGGLLEYRLSDALFPKVSLGEPEFKMQYGVRGLLVAQKPVELDALPGVKSAVELYNGVSASREQVDMPRYAGFVKNVVASIRYLTGARNYKGLLSVSDGLFAMRDLYGPAGAPAAPAAAAVAGVAARLQAPQTFAITVGEPARPAAGAAAAVPAVPRNAVFAIGKGAQALSTSVESSSQDDELAKIVGVINGDAAVRPNRRMERIYNLVDMNVIPINVHALMRDAPLANLYNYEYTFEQMIASLYGEQARLYTNVGDPDSINDTNTRSTRQMLLRLMVNPYLELGTEPRVGAPLAPDYTNAMLMYGSDVADTRAAGFVHRIFRGDNNLGLGRPKLLSDDIAHKCLLTSAYPSKADYSEAGPGVGAGHARARLAAPPLPKLVEDTKRLFTMIVHGYQALLVPKHTIPTGAGLYSASSSYLCEAADTLYVAIPALAAKFNEIQAKLNFANPDAGLVRTEITDLLRVPGVVAPVQLTGRDHNVTLPVVERALLTDKNTVRDIAVSISPMVFRPNDAIPFNGWDENALRNLLQNTATAGTVAARGFGPGDNGVAVAAPTDGAGTHMNTLVAALSQVNGLDINAHDIFNYAIGITTEDSVRLLPEFSDVVAYHMYGKAGVITVKPNTYPAVGGLLDIINIMDIAFGLDQVTGHVPKAFAAALDPVAGIAHNIILPGNGQSRHTFSANTEFANLINGNFIHMLNLAIIAGGQLGVGIENVAGIPAAVATVAYQNTMRATRVRISRILIESVAEMAQINNVFTAHTMAAVADVAAVAGGPAPALAAAAAAPSYTGMVTAGLIAGGLNVLAIAPGGNFINAQANTFDNARHALAAAGIRIDTAADLRQAMLNHFAADAASAAALSRASVINAPIELGMLTQNSKSGKQYNMPADITTAVCGTIVDLAIIVINSWRVGAAGHYAFPPVGGGGAVGAHANGGAGALVSALLNDANGIELTAFDAASAMRTRLIPRWDNFAGMLRGISNEPSAAGAPGNFIGFGTLNNPVPPAAAGAALENRMRDVAAALPLEYAPDNKLRAVAVGLQEIALIKVVIEMGLRASRLAACHLYLQPNNDVFNVRPRASLLSLGRLINGINPFSGKLDGVGNVNAPNGAAAAQFGAGIAGVPVGARSLATLIPTLVGVAAPGWIAHTPENNTATLTFLKSQPDANGLPDTVIAVVNLHPVHKLELETAGRARFDTMCIRKLMYIMMLMRLVGKAISNDLTQSRNIVVKAQSAFAPGITEYGMGFSGPNEASGTLLPNGLPRFNDQDAF
jgi:hypothetical protein